MEDPIEVNRQLWEEWTEAHLGSGFYDVAGFLAGRDPLDGVVSDALGPVEGKRLLHLQCHFGMDTLALARRGAVVTGVDFSPKAIATARDLAARTGLPATFVLSPLGELPERLAGEFDVVFTSGGVLPWLGDLEGWARVIARFLAPGGLFAMVEEHPFNWIFDSERDDDRLVPDARWTYFTREPVAWKNEGSYTGETPPAKYDHHYEWMHSLSEILMSLVGAGLTLERFEEHPTCGYRALPFLVQDDDGAWRTPPGMPDLPLSLTLRMRRPGT